jgi:hypothetical protein
MMAGQVERFGGSNIRIIARDPPITAFTVRGAKVRALL